MSDWPFADPEDVAVITVRQITSGESWIHYVSHDADDGCWQFMPIQPPSEQDATMVSLIEMVAIDSSLRQLADLPLGWHAWRDRPNATWNRAQKTV